MQQDQKKAIELRKEQIWWILLPLVMAVAVAFVMPAIERYQQEAQQRRCLHNMRNLALWTLTYAADNEGILPTGPDWAGEIAEYVQDSDAFVCPAADPEADAASYVLNPDLRGLDVSLIEKPEETVLIYEGNVGEVVERHDGGANYAFADGSVRWLETPPAALTIADVDQP
jgi:prepilin-type processing-associated H-X9-DG protein